VSRRTAAALAGLAVVASTAIGCTARRHNVPPTSTAATPIKHLVVIYDENVSFDHYFGTYPNAANPPGDPAFHAAPGTPAVNGLTPGLLTHNPNAANPKRLDRSQLFTCDNDHDYTAEQKAYDGGAMDKFVQTVGPDGAKCNPDTVMDYYDGNTVTALWIYAQHFSMSDNSFDVTFGPTMVGHLNLIAGQTNGGVVTGGKSNSMTADGTAINNIPARYDVCSSTAGPHLTMNGRNIGNLLSASHVTWGYFSEGFRPTSGTSACGAEHANMSGSVEHDYFSGAITEPFQYWKSTANPEHVAPASTTEIGNIGRANHQYDLSDLWTAADAGRLPQVSFIKPASYDNGHAGSSDPLDEQRFLVDTVNRLEKLPTWSSTAVIIAWDDSDGWYDHQAAPITNPSYAPAHDVLSGPGKCGGPAKPLGGVNGRCGPGPRQPLLIISPFAKRNYVDHTVTTQASILEFIEDNWLAGERLGGGSFDASAGRLNGMLNFAEPTSPSVVLDPDTGEPTSGS
jgi:phospholipase C